MAKITVDLEDEQVGVVFTLGVIERRIEEYKKEIETVKLDMGALPCDIAHIRGKISELRDMRQILLQFM